MDVIHLEVHLSEEQLFPDEVDTRFSFCAVATLYLIDRLHVIDLDKAVQFVLSCYNFDGGFGTRPGSESHAGQVGFFVAVDEKLKFACQSWIQRNPADQVRCEALKFRDLSARRLDV